MPTRPCCSGHSPTCSRNICGSRRDRHQNIGAGQIGARFFAGLLTHPATAGVPFVVETPGPQAAHAADVTALRRLGTPAEAPGAAAGR